MIKRSNHQKEIAILYVPNNKASQLTWQKLTKIKDEIDKSVILSTKISMVIENLKNTVSFS